MEMVLLTALGVGGATIFGSLMGFVFRNISHKFSDIVLAFAAGVMLSAAVRWKKSCLPWKSALPPAASCCARAKQASCCPRRRAV